MYYFLVIFKIVYIREFCEYVIKLYGKDFKDVVFEVIRKLKIKDICYCYYSMMCNYMWYYYRNEYVWYL